MGGGVTGIECVCQHYSICSLCSGGKLAKCQARVNDPRQRIFGERAVCVSVWISRFLVNLLPQTDASAIHTSLMTVQFIML